MSKSFGKKIKELRLYNGLTLEEVAARIGTTKNYVWQLEDKTDSRPSGKLLLDISTLFGVSPGNMIDDDKLLVRKDWEPKPVTFIQKGLE